MGKVKKTNCVDTTVIDLESVLLDSGENKFLG